MPKNSSAPPERPIDLFDEKVRTPSKLTLALCEAAQSMSRDAIKNLAECIQTVNLKTLKDFPDIAELLTSIHKNCMNCVDVEDRRYTGSPDLADKAVERIRERLLQDIVHLNSLVPSYEDEAIATQSSQQPKKIPPKRSVWKKLILASTLASAAVLSLFLQRSEKPDSQAEKVAIEKSEEKKGKEQEASRILETQKREKETERPQSPLNRSQSPITQPHFAGELRRMGESHLPNIDAAELARAGEQEGNEQQVVELPIATITNLAPEIDDVLWITGSFRMDGKGVLRQTTPNVDKLKGDDVATVHLGGSGGMFAAEGQTIVLPRPVGYAVAEVTLDSPLKHVFNKKTQTLTFEEEGHRVNVIYTVRETDFEYPEPPKDFAWDNTRTVERQKDTTDLIALLKNKDIYASYKQDQLGRHLGSFTYITSKQLQMLLSALPGSLEQKMEYIRYGDCDTLALYIAGVQADAGEIGFVHVGMQEKGNALHKQDAHAVAQDDDKQFETTDKTKNSLENVVFEPEDLDTLVTIIKEIPENPTVEEGVQGYEKFNTALTTILDKNSYGRFNGRDALARTSAEALRTLGNLWSDLKKTSWDLKNSENPLVIGLGMLLMIPLMIGIMFALYGVLKAAEYIHEKIYRKPIFALHKRSVRKNEVLAGETIKHALGTSKMEGVHVRVSAADIERMYKEMPDLELAFPKKEALALPPEKAALFVKLALGWPHLRNNLDWYGSRPFHIVFSMLSMRRSQRDVRKAITPLLGNDKTTIEKIMKACSGVSRCENDVESEKENTTQEVAKAMKRGLRTASNTRGPITLKLNQGENVTSRAGLKIGDLSMDHVEYEPGMDKRLISKRNFGKEGQFLVRVREAEQRQPGVAIVVALTNKHYSEDIYELSAILHAVKQKGKCAFTIDTITFVAEGTVVKHLPKAHLRLLLADKSPSSIETVLTMARNLRNEHVTTLRSLKNNNFMDHRVQRFPSGAKELAEQQLSQGKPCIVIGIGTDEFMKIKSDKAYCIARFWSSQNEGLELRKPSHYKH